MDSNTLRLMLARAKSVKVAHSSDYIAGAVDLDLQNGKVKESASTVWFNMGETGDMKCRYVPKASLENITISDHRLRWAVDGMRFTAPLPLKECEW